MNLRKAPNINQLWANLMVEQLVRFGADQFVLSPGSRCTPLTAAVAYRDDVNIVKHFDERGAAFFALGYARAAGKPATLVCTSGTATVNYFPAVVEASMDMVPMLTLTADRPAALRGTGANQTIYQEELYGRYVRYFKDLPCPDAQLSPQLTLKAVDDAVRQALATPAGPTHVNCQFDEPLAPLGQDEDFGEYLRKLDKWLDSKAVADASASTISNATNAAIDSVASVLNRNEHGLIVVGALKRGSATRSILSLAERLGWPVFADIRSGLRLGEANANLIHYFDQLLLSDRIQTMPLTTILHLGGVMTSKRFNQWVSSRKPQNYIQVVENPFRHDPNRVVTDRIEASIGDFCSRLKVAVERKSLSPRGKWIAQANAAVGNMVDGYVEEETGLSEIAVARLASRYLGSDTGLFLSGSMPFRDMDMYADPAGSPIMVTANRGASGIDGSIATAAGLAHGLKAPVTAVIGDLSFLHDANSLSLLKAGQSPVTLIVINNNGGGIFSFLPVSGCTDIFEKYFGMSHNLSLEKIVAAFEIDYHRPADRDSFTETYRKVSRNDRSSVIEVASDREQNFRAHQALQDKIRKAVDRLSQ